MDDISIKKLVNRLVANDKLFASLGGTPNEEWAKEDTALDEIISALSPDVMDKVRELHLAETPNDVGDEKLDSLVEIYQTLKEINKKKAKSLLPKVASLIEDHIYDKWPPYEAAQMKATMVNLHDIVFLED